MQVNKIKTYGGHRYCWDKFWPGANGSVNKVPWKESDRKCKTSICYIYTIFQSTSVSPNAFLVNTARAFRYIGVGFDILAPFGYVLNNIAKKISS